MLITIIRIVEVFIVYSFAIVHISPNDYATIDSGPLFREFNFGSMSWLTKATIGHHLLYTIISIFVEGV